MIPARLLAALVGGGLLLACPGSTTPLPYTPITGVIIPAANIVAGHGCGAGPDQVYKYAVIVSFTGQDGGGTQPLYAGVFDCFVDGVFENLPNEGGLMSFTLSVYAYDKAGYPACLDACPLGADPSGNPCFPDAGSAPLFAAAAQWQTTCAVTQQLGAPSSAACAPLEVPPAPADGGGMASPVCGMTPAQVEAGVSNDAQADGGAAPPDAVADADASDATADGAPDSPTDSTVDAVASD